LGLDEKIQGMIHNHIGAGVTKDEAKKLGLPAEDHLPRTLMERIVCHSDTLVGECKRKNLKEAVDKMRRIGAHAGAERMIRLHNDLEKELGIDIDDLLPSS
jgi:HD superfamily phosphodiesterase